MILSAEDPAFARHIDRRTRDGFRPNVNVLGEAILGDGEAQRRTQMVLDRLARTDVDYVSVKISAISAYVSALAHDDSIEHASGRLRVLYRAAATSRPAKFVNLDMEEYRDLELTAAVFRRVLDETEFNGLRAGIVLQAYLPDSHRVARELCEWAIERVATGGAPIKVRLVKGANLAMECVEAELHGWPAAPFASKAEVDASYKALLELLLEPRHDASVDVGLATHNLFDIAWGLLARRDLLAAGRRDRLAFEMLEGMAMAEASAVLECADTMFMYSPVVGRDDFSAAIAYLVRRLDENTTPENYLTAAFDISPGNAIFDREASKFRRAVADRHGLDLRARRQQDRTLPVAATSSADCFANEPDTDFTLALNRRWIADHLTHPTSPDRPPHACIADVDAAVGRALAARSAWAAIAARERTDMIHRVGDVVAAERGRILATMAYEAGKTVLQGDPEVSEAVDFAHYYARSIGPIEDLARSGVASAPLGTVVVAPPWNFPYAIAAGGVLAALAAGNTVILKPPPQSPLTAALVAHHCWEAGIPEDVLQLVAAPDDDAGRRLITHPDVDAVILTGGYATAQTFLDWKPSLRLHAETSGKNAIVITATADLDLAARELVRSAFGHAGQKCSAASLAIIEASVYDSPTFRRQLRDAVETLRTGPAHLLTTDVGPLIGPPGESLLRALTQLDPGESWLVEPRSLDDGRTLWSPGIRLGVRPGSWFSRTECFGPVLGLIRTESLDDAIAIQNGTDFGLTAGLHALDPAEVDRWLERVEAGNVYINRGITGAIVQRQPFGGWKRSVVGPTAKAGGPHYVATLRSWPTSAVTDLTAVSDAFVRWAERELAAEHDPSGLVAERNVQRYRRLPAGVAVRLGEGAEPTAAAIARTAAAVTGTRLVVSSASADPDEAFARRVAALRVDRVRVAGATTDVVRRAVHAAGIVLDERSIVTCPEIELPRWLREQAVSRTMHRHGRMVQGDR